MFLYPDLATALVGRIGEEGRGEPGSCLAVCQVSVLWVKSLMTV